MKRTVVIGGGPIGLFSAMTLARRGHHVVLVDRDPGPAADGSWRRAGVMQFMHPHFCRPDVRLAMLAELPDVWAAILAAGGEERLLPNLPEQMTGLACRRSVLERVLRSCAATEPRLATVTGHVDRICVEHGRTTGVIVDGYWLEGDLVISATGRSSRLGDELRGPVEGGSCGFSYVSRMYRARPGSAGCTLPGPAYAVGPGYVTVAIPQDDNTLSALISRPTGDPALSGIRDNAGFAAAAAAIPNLAPWTDPDEFEPITDVLIGGGLTNTFWHQGPQPGTPPASGLFFIGDATSTTNPAAGRGITLGLRQARRLIGLLDDNMAYDDASRALDQWNYDNVRPWFRDHVRWDASMLHRFAGGDIDLDDRIPSDVIVAAAEDLPEIGPYAGQYLGMLAPPSVLDPVEDTVRELLRAGWRPASAGPTAFEIADIVNRANATASRFTAELLPA
jgi:2-polyprenyl-6-methoxyphenol hydroxylase-like FAD-dependent oxidoreductase